VTSKLGEPHPIS